jgi:hypothetical protein
LDHLKQLDIQPQSIIFEKLSEFVPDKGTPTEMEKKYNEFFHSKDNSKQLLDSCENTKEICESPPKSPMTLLSSYHTLYCKRCFLFDCHAHRGESPPKIEPNSFIYNREVKTKKKELVILDQKNTVTSKTPCQSDCYLLHLDQFFLVEKTDCQENKENKEPNSIISPNLNNRGEEKWSSAEESYYNFLKKHSLFNSCLLSDLLERKSCFQIKKFIEAKDFEYLNIIASDLMANSKKKKNVAKNSVTKTLINDTLEEEDEGVVVAIQKNNGNRNYSPCDHYGEPCNDKCECVRRKKFLRKVLQL